LIVVYKKCKTLKSMILRIIIYSGEKEREREREKVAIDKYL